MVDRKRLQKKRQQKKIKTNLKVAGIVIGLISIIGLIVWREVRPAIGTKVDILRSDHVEVGAPVESPTDPPTSGSHYASPMPAGFYTKESPQYLSGNHDGYLIHSLEHRYVVFWYNCDLLEEQSCNTLLSEIQGVMDDFNGFKLIAFPRPSISAHW